VPGSFPAANAVPAAPRVSRPAAVMVARNFFVGIGFMGFLSCSGVRAPDNATRMSDR
jgi:hypothetical protein